MGLTSLMFIRTVRSLSLSTVCLSVCLSVCILFVHVVMFVSFRCKIIKWIDVLSYIPNKHSCCLMLMISDFGFRQRYLQNTSLQSTQRCWYAIWGKWMKPPPRLWHISKASDILSYTMRMLSKTAPYVTQHIA